MPWLLMMLWQTGLISLSPVIKALKHKPADFPHRWFRQVDDAGNYTNVDFDRINPPTAWIVRGAEAGKRDGECASMVMPSFDVVLVIENARSHKPNEHDEALLNYRRAVFRQLQGLDTDGMSKTVSFVGGKPLVYEAGRMVWADRYNFEQQLTNYLDDPVPFTAVQYVGDQDDEL